MLYPPIRSVWQLPSPPFAGVLRSVRLIGLNREMITELPLNYPDLF
jgi:hypothetical protein